MRQAEEQSNEVWIELSGIVGPEHLRPATPEDAVDAVQPAGVIAPGNAQEVAQVLRYCASAGVSIIPRGGGTQLGLGNRPRKADFVLSLERLNRVIEHAWGDMTVTVEAGCTIDKLQSVVREHGQQLGADPRQPERATVGGVLATAESGTLRIRYGAIRDLVLGVEMALADGSVIKAGGKVVKNVAGYDLTKLAIGSMGTLGIITRAVFRLHPVPRATATFAAMLPAAAEAEKRPAMRESSPRRFLPRKQDRTTGPPPLHCLTPPKPPRPGRSSSWTASRQPTRRCRPHTRLPTRNPRLRRRCSTGRTRMAQ